MKKPKIILWDLETLVNISKFNEDSVMFSVGNYPGRTMKASISSIICFGYKELGEKKAHCISAWDFPKKWAKNVNDDYELVKAAREILVEADAVVTHYGIKFDSKFFNHRLKVHNLPRLPKIPHIDTQQLARRNLFAYSNKLDSLAKEMGLEQKISTSGENLWGRCREREKAAMKKMTAYCKQDVEVLEQVFRKLEEYADNMPNYNMFNPGSKVCPSCGSKHIIKYGTKRTKTAQYQRYQCQGCGSISYTNTYDKLPRKD